MSDRSKTISRLKKNRGSRAAYIKAKLSVLIPAQLRALRMKSFAPRQEDLAKAAEMKQSRISAMEKPGAVNYNLETLIRMASTFKVGLKVEFVSLSEMLRWENQFEQDSFSVVTIDNDLGFSEADQEAGRDFITTGVIGPKYYQDFVGASPAVENEGSTGISLMPSSPSAGALEFVQVR